MCRELFRLFPLNIQHKVWQIEQEMETSFIYLVEAAMQYGGDIEVIRGMRL